MRSLYYIAKLAATLNDSTSLQTTLLDNLRGSMSVSELFDSAQALFDSAQTILDAANGN